MANQWKEFFFIEESDVTAINRIYDDEAEGRIEGIYDLNGRKLERLQRGINIVRMSDGKTKKVVIKWAQSENDFSTLPNVNDFDEIKRVVIKWRR